VEKQSTERKLHVYALRCYTFVLSHVWVSEVADTDIKVVYVWVKKIFPDDLWQFFQNGLEFFNQILHAYYAFLSMLDYKFLFNYLQLQWNYAILSVTTQFTSCAQNVHHRPKRMLAFSDFFPKRLGIFSPNFACL